MDQLGAYLGPTWGQLGPTWAHFGPSWANLGATCGQLGVNLAHCGLSWAYLGQFRAYLGPTSSQIEISLGPPRTQPGAKVCRDHCRPIAQKPIGSVDGIGALAPNWIRPLSLSGSTEAVEAKRFVGLVVAAANNDETQRLPKVNSPKSPPAGSTLLPPALFVSGDPWPKGRRN